MKEYVEVSPEEKLKLLQKDSMGETWISLEESKWCLHCNKQFTGSSVRVYREQDDSRLWLECGTPGCDGSPLDWADYPWWDETHPKTQRNREADKKFLKVTKSKHPERN